VLERTPLTFDIPRIVDRGTDAGQLFAGNGVQYYDLCCGTGCTGLDGILLEEIFAQVAEMPLNTYAYETEFRDEAEDELRLMYPGYAFAFFSGGAECVEAALRVADVLVSPLRPPVTLSFTGAFHGKTFRAGRLGDMRHHGKHFLVANYERPTLPSPYHEPAPGGETGALIAPTTIIFEPMQTRNGVRPMSQTQMDELFAYAMQCGSIVIADEISTTIRSGYPLLSCANVTGYKPDIICVGKNIGQGIPVAVLGVRADHVDAAERVSLTSGFGGNALACVAVERTLHHIRVNNILEKIQKRGVEFLNALTAEVSDLVHQVVGVGFWFGLELKVEAIPVARALAHRHWIVSPAGPMSIRLSPPFELQDAIWFEFLSDLREVLSAEN